MTDTSSDAIALIGQLVHRWTREIDHNDGVSIDRLLTDDCVYMLGGAPYQGPRAIADYYIARKDRLTKDGALPIQRHAIASLVADPTSSTEASITFLVIHFMAVGALPLPLNGPGVVADVHMDVRFVEGRGWCIAKFDSDPMFLRK